MCSNVILLQIIIETMHILKGLPRRQFEEVLAKSSANLPSAIPYTAPAIKHYGSQPNFVTSPNR